MVENIRLAVIVTDFGEAAHVGGYIERTVRTFDLPQEIADFIRKSKGQWSTVTLAIEVSPAPCMRDVPNEHRTECPHRTTQETAVTPSDWPGPYGLCADGQPHVPQPGSDPLMCGRCKNDLV